MSQVSETGAVISTSELVGTGLDAAKAAEPAKHQLPISKEDKTTILLNVEGAVKDVVKALATRGDIKGTDIKGEDFKHLPTSLTGVMVHYLVRGLKEDFDMGFEEQPVCLKVRSTSAMDKKVAGKKRLLTREEKNEIVAQMDMRYYMNDVMAGTMTPAEAADKIKTAFEKKQEFEKMGYMLPLKKTEYPYWADEATAEG